jgi:methyltransferase of ATP-grasp peptide maturase system
VTGWAARAETLAASLVAKGAITDPRWRAAFAQTPRHGFVPAFYDDGTLVDSGDPRQRQRWLARVYDDDTLVTQRAQVPGTPMVWPTSSSTAPVLMARMLDLLDVRDDSRVLEIGTGTGYNAALLCHRLGDTNVTSIDIDAGLVEAARARLAELGYRPHLLAGDGAAGAAAFAPYDRIIATAGIQAVPTAWVRQLADDGVIVADVRGNLVSHLVRLRKTDDGGTHGRFLAEPGHFMWMRRDAGNPLRAGGSYPTVRHLDADETRTTRTDPAVLDNPDVRFLIQLRIPDANIPSSTVYHDRAGVLLTAEDDESWAFVSDDTPHDSRTVVQGGPRRLWDDVEAAEHLWTGLGKPTPDRFGLTVTDQRHQVWLDTPHHAIDMGATRQ